MIILFPMAISFEKLSKRVFCRVGSCVLLRISQLEARSLTNICVVDRMPWSRVIKVIPLKYIAHSYCA